MSNETVSKLIIRLDGQLLSEEDWYSHTPPMNFELREGMPFSNESTLFRDKLLVALLFSAGIKHVLSILSKESLDLIREELKEDWRDMVAEADRLARKSFAEEQEIHEMSRRMIKYGISIEEVSTITGLSKDDVIRIANETID